KVKHGRKMTRLKLDAFQEQEFPCLRYAAIPQSLACPPNDLRSNRFGITFAGSRAAGRNAPLRIDALKSDRKFTWCGEGTKIARAGAQLGVGGRVGEEKMDTSRYIARLMGPVMLIIGIGMAAGMFVEGESYSSLMKEFIGSRALIFITGVLALLAGLIV